jgi:hypothetical protein
MLAFQFPDLPRLPAGSPLLKEYDAALAGLLDCMARPDFFGDPGFRGPDAENGDYVQHAAALAQRVKSFHAALLAAAGRIAHGPYELSGGEVLLHRRAQAATGLDSEAVQLLQAGPAVTGTWVQSLFSRVTRYDPDRWAALRDVVAQFGTAVRAAVGPAEDPPSEVEWSLAKGPAFWAKVFDRSAKLIPKLFAERKVRSKKLGPKSYMVDLADVPEGWKQRARKATKPPPK